MTRWTIVAKIRTASRLMVGTGTKSAAGADRAGAPTAIPDLDPPVLVNDIQLDAIGRASIPGASIRGACRAWMRTNFPDRDLRLFGDADTNAGALAFRWAHATALVTAGVNHEYDARWDSKTSYSAVDAAVAIDPASRTATEHLLRFYRYVPAGVEFTIRIGAHDARGRCPVHGWCGVADTHAARERRAGALAPARQRRGVGLRPRRHE